MSASFILGDNDDEPVSVSSERGGCLYTFQAHAPTPREWAASDIVSVDSCASHGPETVSLFTSDPRGSDTLESGKKLCLRNVFLCQVK